MTDEKKPRHVFVAAAAYYVHLAITLKAVARQHGYALAVHGSLTTDMDLIAVPWIDEAAPAEELIEAIRVSVDGIMEEIASSCAPCRTNKVPCPHVDGPVALRSHGRRAWSIYLGKVGGPYLDISVMPRTQDHVAKIITGEFPPP